MSVQVPPDSTGKVVRTLTDSGSQEQQAVVIGNGTDTNVVVLTDMDTGAGTENALNVSLRKSASGGSVEAGTSTNPLRTDPTGTTVQPVSGTVTANIGTSSLALDATLTGGTQKTKLVDSGGSNVATVSAAGALKVDGSAVTQPVSGTVTTTPPSNASTNISQLNGHTFLEGGVNGSTAIGGTVATNVAITANPVNLGAQAVSSENTAVTTARQVQLVADLVGKLIVLPYANPENFVSGCISTAMTGTTSTSLVAAPAAGLRNYITQITVSNSHATVGTDILIQDGNAGTTLYVIPAAAAYGGATITFPVPLRQPTTATAIYAQNVTTGSSIKISATGYKGA